MKALIISNPQARRNSSHAAAGGIASRLLLAGYDVEIKAPGSLAESDAAITGSKASVIVVVGGDGTASAAARTLVNMGGAGNPLVPPLAVYPAGTVNDFATSAKVPADLDAFCEGLLKHRSKPVNRRQADDAGLSNRKLPQGEMAGIGQDDPPPNAMPISGKAQVSKEGGGAAGNPGEDGIWLVDMGRLVPHDGSGSDGKPRNFLNVVSVGGFVDSAFTVPPGAKSRLGSLAYYLEGARKITTEPLRPVRMKWQSAESSGDEDIMLALVTNGPSAAGFKTIAPNSAYDDGLLDVIMIRSCDVLDLVALFFIILSKSHLDDYRVIHFRTARIELVPTEKMVCTMDGEMGPAIPGEIVSIPGAVKLVSFD